jgi:uncharacterized protein (TIGR03437 family)
MNRTICTLCLCLGSSPAYLLAQSGSTLNVSHDLIAKGIAMSNMQPDTPKLDSRPLLESAIAYAQKNSIATVTADRGAYYFLTLHNPQTHVLLNGVSNLTLDFQNSDLYFQQSNRGAILCQSCVSVTMQNFTVDFLQLPFTQVTIKAVNSTGRMLTFDTIPGYQAPSDFNKARTPDDSDSYYGFVFRNGVPIPQTGDLVITMPTSGGTLKLGAPGDPWAQTANLAAIQSGDILLMTDRGGPHTIHFTSSQNCTVQRVSIYASGAMALTFPGSPGMTIDHVQVIPRPGTTRLVSSNADGIHGTAAAANNTITGNIVRRTCDDELAYDSAVDATVFKASTGATVTVQRSGASIFPVGALLAFIDPMTQATLGTAHVVSENPSDDKQTFSDGETVTLTLDQSAGNLAAGVGMVNTDPAQHGGGSVIRNNLVQEGIFSRGVWLSGVSNISVHDNFIQRTSKTGLFVQQYASPAFEGPSSNITIQNNVVDAAITFGSPSIGPIVTAASIHTVAENDQSNQVTSSSHSGIVVNGNRVTNSPRTAIRLENVNGGDVSNNTIQGYGLAPKTNVYLIPGCCESLAQYEADFAMPLLMTNTVAVTNSGNAMTPDTSNLITIGSTANYLPKLSPGSIAFAYGSNLGATTAVTVTDTQGTARNATISSTSSQQVNFNIPADTAPGIATVTIGSQSGGVLIDSVAPGFYSANGSGSGVAAATAATYSADGSQVTPQTFATCPSGGGCVAAPLDLGGATDKLVLTLYGTGMSGFSGMQNVAASIGGAIAPILFVGAQGQYAGLDQVDLVVPRSLAGAGEVPIVLTVDGQTANVVTVNVK